MIFDCPDRLRRAVRIRAARTGKRDSETIQRILEDELADELKEADEYIKEESKPRKAAKD